MHRAVAARPRHVAAVDPLALKIGRIAAHAGRCSPAARRGRRHRATCRRARNEGRRGSPTARFRSDRRGVVRHGQQAARRARPHLQPELERRSRRAVFRLPQRRIGSGLIGQPQERPGPVAGRRPAADERRGRGAERFHVLLLEVGLVVLPRGIEHVRVATRRAVQLEVVDREQILQIVAQIPLAINRQLRSAPSAASARRASCPSCSWASCPRHAETLSDDTCRYAEIIRDATVECTTALKLLSGRV